MSEEQEPLEESGGEAEVDATDTAKDLPLSIVVVGITIAVLVFGYLGWKRYQVLHAETMRELAVGMPRAFEEGKADAHRLAAEKDAADAAQQDPGSPATAADAPPAATPTSAQTAPTGP